MINSILTPVYPIIGLCNNIFSIAPHPKGGEFLVGEIFNWKALGFEIVVSLLTEDEQSDLHLEIESELCENLGILYLNYPIRDEVPNSMEETKIFLNILVLHLTRKKKVLFHCRGGVGRSSMILTLVAAQMGIAPECCFKLISDSRGEQAPETNIQKNWVKNMVEHNKSFLTER